MSGWLVTLTYEVNAGLPILEALFASWQDDRTAAVRSVASIAALGSRVTPRIVAPLSDSMLRGLRLQPGETARLRVG